ncbi:HNH endonuclease [Paraburkholderia sabiae]|uniref:retron system putative HNH endonuclease n=1 Tax=Paraburkholderia sabiae TaxID=273251 RepID=UPI001CB0FDF1|nr:retron system putative HNH endonuclease [Paraburkholderia sabiae]CAG9225669.1 HNH endonuclease [Paraburkholderia sabiae]
MRPVMRGVSPQTTDFKSYDDAKHHLVSRLGSFCSYCERHIKTNLAVEHIQPKGLAAYAHLTGTWENFLLGCVNCNSTKGDKDILLADVFLPDRDNTSAAFDYLPDGKIAISNALSPVSQTKAENLLSAVGLDKPIVTYLDENGKQVALDRVAQRMEVWGIASEARNDVAAAPGNHTVRKLVVKLALAHGFFSIWMEVFAGDSDMRKRLIRAFPGTEASRCFDMATTALVRPGPNPDTLPHGGKI